MLEIVGIRKKFVNSAAPVLDGIDLRIETGECLSLLGPSGCGKTTLLRILAGLEFPDAGEVRLDGQNLLGKDAATRPFHMVFQKHALFPHLTVFENIAFGLRVRKVPADQIAKRVGEVLSLVRLEGFAARKPATLSGGQSQRVALARALVNRPRVLLLDEPFSALDLKLREGMAAELRDLQKSLGLTFVFVTHDQQEAFALSDRVALMNAGRFEQVSSPRELYDRPRSLFAARFVGQASVFAVKRVQDARASRSRFETEAGTWTGTVFAPLEAPAKWVAVVRPENFALGEPRASSANALHVRLRDWIFRGAQILLRAEGPGGGEVLVAVSPSEFENAKLGVGSDLKLHVLEERTWLYPDEARA